MGGGNFFLAYFFERVIYFQCIILLSFFRESYITCIITVVGAQPQHEGMFLKHGGGGRKKFPTVSWGGGGGGGRFFSRVFARGVGALFFFAYRFCRTTHHPTPAINNERPLSIENSMLILWIIFQIRKGNHHGRKREYRQKTRSTREHRPPWLKQIIAPILPTVLCMMGGEAAKQQQCYYALHCLGGERLTPKVLHGSLPTPRSGHETAIMFLAHLLILKDP